MYNEYFGFSAAPFSIAPDPRYLFMSSRHREALAHLLYGLRIDGGFVLLTGEVGTGKTTICRCLLEQVPDDCDIAFILNPKLDTVELLATLCDELDIPVAEGERSIKVLTDRINQHLLAAHARGRKTVMIVDEAQNLSNEVLEQLRLLTNLETNERKLLQIILLGQPELRERLAQADMRQLAQRIVARYHLEPLSGPDVAAYIRHRLAVAGGRQQLFPEAVIGRLYRLSGGTPRLINVICDRALLGAYAEGKTTVTTAILNTAAREVLGAKPESAVARRVAITAALTLALAAGAASAWRYTQQTPPELPASRSPTADPSAPASDVQVVQVQGTDRAPSNEAEIVWPESGEHWLHEVMAVRSLFSLWNLDTPPVGVEAACRLIAARGIYCLRRTGNLDDLRGMNMPAILQLHQTGGPDFMATLMALDARDATLSFGGTTRKVPIDSLKRQWHGNYTLLWRPPQGWYRSLGPGMQGADVAWAIRQLGHWANRPAHQATGNVYDAHVEQTMRAFQRSSGLPEDGVTGAMTAVRLATVGAPEIPVLAKQGE